MGAVRKIKPAALPAEQVEIEARTWAAAKREEAQAVLAGIHDLIVTAENVAEINGFLRDICRAKDEIEAKRKSFTQPLNTVLRALNDEFRPAREALESVERKLKDLLAAFQLAEAARQREAFQLAGDAMRQGETEIVTAALQVANEAGPAELAGTSVREVWTAEVIAPDLLPRDYLVPDLDKINAHAKSTHADTEPMPIPGVRFTKQSIVTVRRA